MDKLEELQAKKKQIVLGGGQDKIDIQHSKGKFTARERLELLFDKGSFVELMAFVEHRCRDFGLEKQQCPGDGVVTGYGLVDGRTVFAFAQDFTVLGGSLGERHAEKIAVLQAQALKSGMPIVGLFDSGGARIQEGVSALEGFGKIFFLNARSSGVIPQISAIMGPCAGGAVYSPALTDFVFMVDKTSNMFITGPQVIVAVTGEQITAEKLGGAEVHCATSGVAHYKAQDETQCLADIRDLLSYLPSNNEALLPRKIQNDPKDRLCPELDTIVPDSPNRPYDMLEVIHSLADGGVVHQVQALYAKNLITAYIRVDGRTVGVVANQPKSLAGCLDINASDKAARFIRTCDAFRIPLVTLVDVPGFLPGSSQEFGGIIRHGAKLLYAYSEATVPKITVITRKAYGGAYIGMCSKELGADLVFAWPTAEVAVMGPEGAANIVFKNEIANAAQPDEKRQELVKNYKENFASPYQAARMGAVSDVIQPAQTRYQIARALLMLERKKERTPDKKHGNMPL